VFFAFSMTRLRPIWWLRCWRAWRWRSPTAWTYFSKQVAVSMNQRDGGGARLAYWGQLLAAALNRPLTYRAGSEIARRSVPRARAHGGVWRIRSSGVPAAAHRAGGPA